MGEWCDLQLVYARQMGEKGQTSLQSAMEALHIQADRPAHDALNDAWFTALVAQKLDLKLGQKQYREYAQRQKKRSRLRPNGGRNIPFPAKPGQGTPIGETPFRIPI